MVSTWFEVLKDRLDDNSPVLRCGALEELRSVNLSDSERSTIVERLDFEHYGSVRDPHPFVREHAWDLFGQVFPRACESAHARNVLTFIGSFVSKDDIDQRNASYTALEACSADAMEFNALLETALSEQDPFRLAMCSLRCKNFPAIVDRNSKELIAALHEPELAAFAADILRASTESTKRDEFIAALSAARDESGEESPGYRFVLEALHALTGERIDTCPSENPEVDREEEYSQAIALLDLDNRFKIDFEDPDSLFDDLEYIVLQPDEKAIVLVSAVKRTRAVVFRERAIAEIESLLHCEESCLWEVLDTCQNMGSLGFPLVTALTEIEGNFEPTLALKATRVRLIIEGSYIPEWLHETDSA